MAHSIIAARALDLRCIVSSDAYQKTAEDYGAEYLRRPAELCGDEVGDVGVIAHAIGECDLTGLIAYLRPTTPCRLSYHIEQAIKLLEGTPDATGLRSVELMDESAYKCFEFNGPQLWAILHEEMHDLSDLPNQQCPPTYKPNGYIDLARVDQIKIGNLWGDGILGYITPHTPEIDTEENFEYAGWFMKRQMAQRNIAFGKEDLCT